MDTLSICRDAARKPVTTIRYLKTAMAGEKVIVFAGIMTLGNLCAMASQLISGLLAARWVSPADLGAYSSILLVQVYSTFLQGGVINGLTRELPYTMATGDRPAASRLASTAFAWAILSGLAGIVAGLAWVRYETASSGMRLVCASTTVSIMCGTYFLKLYLQATMRTTAEFARLAAVQAAVALATIPLTGLVYFYGFAGLCTRTSLAAVLEILLLWRWRPFRVKPFLDTRALLRLVRIGIPILIVTYLELAYSRLDSLVVIKYLGSHQLGLYQPATIVMATSGSVAGAMMSVTYPKMVERYAVSKSLGEALRVARRITVSAAVVGFPVLVVAYSVLPSMINAWMPAYNQGTAACRLALIAAYASIFCIPANIFNVVAKQWIYSAFLIAAAAVFIAVLYTNPLSQRDRLARVAGACLVARVVLSVSVNGAAVAMGLLEKRRLCL